MIVNLLIVFIYRQKNVNANEGVKKKQKQKTKKKPQKNPLQRAGFASSFTCQAFSISFIGFQLTCKFH